MIYENSSASSNPLHRMVPSSPNCVFLVLIPVCLQLKQVTVLMRSIKICISFCIWNLCFHMQIWLKWVLTLIINFHTIVTSSYNGLLLYFIRNQTHMHMHTPQLWRPSHLLVVLPPKSNSRLSHEMAVTFDNVSIQCPAEEWEIV